MAWENIQILNIQSEFLQPSQISDSLSNTGQIFLDWNGLNASDASLTQLRNWIADGSNISNNATLYQDSVWHLYAESPSGQVWWNLCLDKNGQNIFTITIYWGTGTLLNLQICFCIDTVNHKGIIIYGRRYIGEYNYYFAMARTVKSDDNANLLTDIYDFLMAAKYPSYGGGAGSGYIGNSLLSNKKMVGYNVPTSSAESTKTESVNEASATPVGGKPKIGNGFVRIKFLRDLDISNMTEWTPDGAFGWQVTYDSATKENHITGQCNQFWEYYEFPLDVERNKNYTVSLQFKGSNYNYFAHYDTVRILDRWQDATQIQQEDGINGNYVIAESDTHFSNQSNYVDCSVTFNSGNRDKVWLYIGAGYVYTGTWMDLYFKNITVVKNN